MLAEVESLKMRMHGKCGSTTSMAVLFVLTLLLPLSACTQRSPSFDYPSDAPVLQIDLTGGMGAYPHAAAWVPLVTVWGNGRVVFVSREERYEPERALIRETQLSKSTVRRLLAEADILHELDERYFAFDMTGAGTTTFSIQSAGGRETVSVYAFNPELDPAFRDLEQHTEVMDMLRALYRTVVDALPRDALALLPREVSVIARPGGSAEEAQHEWPAELIAHLTGEAAQQATALLPPGPVATFLLDYIPHQITVMPVLPILSAPSAIGPESGLPRHPATTAYLLSDSLPYRFDGVDQAEVAAWYRSTMPSEGWQLAKEEAGLQVWVRGDRGRYPIARLHFRPDRFTIELLTFHDDFPLHPGGAWRECGERRCQIVSGLSLDEARNWFAEYLGYLGWRDGPYLFRKDRESDGGHDLLQLTYEEVEGGIVVVSERTVYQPPVWPYLPTPEPPTLTPSKASR